MANKSQKNGEMSGEELSFFPFFHSRPTVELFSGYERLLMRTQVSATKFKVTKVILFACVTEKNTDLTVHKSLDRQWVKAIWRS